ncbi:MAG TPA: RDD family protein [Candidatus Acidoferrales bacterium]|nr:RDD family protein [Candidatus Acidoferrales bacterium]
MRCSVCEASSEEENSIPIPETVAIGPQKAEATEEPEWRRELSRRLREYRARRHPNEVGESRPELPIYQKISLEPRAEPEEPPKRPRVRNQRPRQPQRVEICIQPELDFSTGDRSHPQSPLVPVAGLAERRAAGAIDATILALTCLGFGALFRSLGGEIVMAKADAVIYLAVVALIYSLYLFVFTTMAGSTPGMQVRGLTVVSMDGTLPETRQLLWRSFGYVLSAAAMMLGYFWALWDEDRFTWHDRISQTYVTSASPVILPEPSVYGSR